jgi:hypothetical protein
MEIIGLVFLGVAAIVALFSGLHYFLGISDTALRVLTALVILVVLGVMFVNELRRFGKR